MATPSTFQIGDRVTHNGGADWFVTKLADMDGRFEVSCPDGWTESALASELSLTGRLSVTHVCDERTTIADENVAPLTDLRFGL